MRSPVDIKRNLIGESTPFNLIAFSVRWTFSLQMAPKKRHEIQIAYIERENR